MCEGAALGAYDSSRLRVTRLGLAPREISTLVFAEARKFIGDWTEGRSIFSAASESLVCLRAGARSMRVGPTACGTVSLARPPPSPTTTQPSPLPATALSSAASWACRWAAVVPHSSVTRECRHSMLWPPALAPHVRNANFISLDRRSGDAVFWT